MIEAGVVALEEGLGSYDSQALVEAIYNAMRRRAPSATACASRRARKAYKAR
jgi:hypothetical protein